jgi:hypothetical protein
MRRLYPRVGRLFARQTFEISLLTDRDELHALLDRPFNVDELNQLRCKICIDRGDVPD